jgi:demethylmenaquinone methyltransferase/2-methoxy-6-polyprenyl-1,4-benzoquinol methylase
VQTSSTPLTRRDGEGNTYQLRALDDGSHHEVLKNFPTPEQAFGFIGPEAHDAEWLAYPHYWVLSYRLASAPA